MAKSTGKVIALIVSFLMVFSSFNTNMSLQAAGVTNAASAADATETLAIAPTNDNEWDVTMEFYTNFLVPWTMAEAWAPHPGWVGNPAGGHAGALVTGNTIQGGGDATGRIRVFDRNSTAAPRGDQMDFHVPVESNYRINMQFDWFPGTPSGTGATAYGRLSINDSHAGGFSNSGGIQANQFINFVSSNWSEDIAAGRGVTYHIGNMLDSVAFRGGVAGGAGQTTPVALNHRIIEENHPEDGQFLIGERHVIGTNAHRSQWLTINLTLDFLNQEITVHITESVTGNVLVDSAVHPFAHQTDETGPFAHWNSDGTSGFWLNHASGNPTTVTRMGHLGGGAVTWNRQVAGFRFFNAGGWRTQLDNLTIQGLVPYMPPVLVEAINLNAARGTFDLVIAPYNVPEGATLDAINIFATTTMYGEESGPDILVATVADAGTHTITVPRGNATHVITAEAVVSGSPTNRSNALTVVHEGVIVPRPGVVTDLTIAAQRGRMDLLWTTIANADEYIIYRAFFERGPFERIGISTDGTFVDNHPRLTNNFHTFYMIEAVGDAGSGGLSEVFASTLSGYIPIARGENMDCRALVGVNLAGDRGAEVLVSAAGPDGATLTEGVFLSWRWFNADYYYNTTFTLYRNGVELAAGLTVTNLVDPTGSSFDVYRIVGSSDESQNITAPDIRVWTNFYQELQLFQPPGQVMQNGRRTHYTANDIIVGDITGDGILDMVVKWFPSNALDAANVGQTGSVVFDAYTVDWNTGETVLLWRLDKGWNMRASSHYSMFGVSDFRGIGRSDVMMTAPTSSRFFRSTDGTDQGLVELPYRVGNGNINANPTTSGNGASHVIGIDGTTGSLIGFATFPGAAMAGAGRNTATIGHIRGHDQRPSFITGGQYGSLNLHEWRITGNDPWQVVAGWVGPSGGGSAGHSIHAADIHGLGFDSLLLGAAVVVPNNINTEAFGSAAVADATGMRVLNNVGVHNNSTQFGPFISYETMFDMMRESNQIPAGVTSADDLRLPNGHPRQVIAIGAEGQNAPNRPSFLVRDVLSGVQLVAYNTMPFTDMRRGMMAHVDPNFPNGQIWSDKTPTYLGDGNWGGPERDGSWDERESGMFALERHANHTNNPALRTGALHQIAHTNPSMNFSLHWSGRLLSDLQCHDFSERVGFFPISTQISMWDYINHREIMLFDSTEVFTNNGTKGTPGTQVDILGDWREEVIFRSSSEHSRVRVHTTTIQTDYVLPWLWEDHNYRMGVSWQANGYNQPPQTSFMPSRGIQTASDIDYFTLTETEGVVITYSPASASERFGFPITGHQLWRRIGDRGNIDLTPRGTLSNSTRIQLLEAGYVLVAEVIGDAPLVDETALVGGTYSYVIVGVSDTANGLKLNHISNPVTIIIEDRSADVVSVTVAPENYELGTIDATVQLVPTVLPENAQNRNVTWESSDELIATVDADGLVTAVGSGITTIRAISVMNSDVYGTSVITVSIPTFQVTFMLDATEVFLTRDVYINTPMGERFPLSPFITGYNFIGWFDALEGGSQLTAETVVTDDRIVFARFSPAGNVEAGDRWQFNFRMPISPATPEGWIEIPLGAANDSFAANTPRLPDSMAEIGDTGIMFGVGPGPGGAGPSTRGGHTTAAGWWGQNPNGLTGTDRFGNTIHVPREIGTGWVSLMELGLTVPNGAFDVIAFLGNAIGGAPRGGLIIHSEPRNTAVRISANPTNLNTVYASRQLLEIPGNQNVDNNRPFALSHHNNIIVRDGYLGITPYQWNANTQAFIIVVVALHAPIEEAIAAAAQLNQTDYSAQSWNVLMEAIAAGQAAMTRGGSHYANAHSQAEIDAFAQAIIDAINALEAPPVEFELTVTSPGATGYSGSGHFAEGVAVTINAGLRTGYDFAGWIFEPEVTLLEGYTAAMALTKFYMPNSAVTATANWTNIVLPCPYCGQTPCENYPNPCPPLPDCDYCADCGECQECSQCLPFDFNAWNNGTLTHQHWYDLGLVVLWFRFTPGGNVFISRDTLNVSAALNAPDGPCAMEFITIDTTTGSPLYANRILANFNAAWERIYLSYTVCEVERVFVIINPRPQQPIEPTLHRITFMRNGGTLNGVARDIAIPNVPSDAAFYSVPVEIPAAAREGFKLVHWRVDFAGENRTHLFLTSDELANFAIPYGHLHALPANSNLIIRAIWELAPVEPPECEDCNAYPCECPELCENCEAYPCECLELCDDCEAYPCECPELCENCEAYPCECAVLCEYCEAYPCLPFSIRLYQRPNGAEMHRLRFNNPNPAHNNLIPAAQFSVTATLPDYTCAVSLLTIVGGANNTIQRIDIPFGNWQTITVTVSRGCASDTVVLVNPLYVSN